MELHEDNHDNLTYFHGDKLCTSCADAAEVARLAPTYGNGVGELARIAGSGVTFRGIPPGSLAGQGAQRVISCDLPGA